MPGFFSSLIGGSQPAADQQVSQGVQQEQQPQQTQEQQPQEQQPQGLDKWADLFNPSEKDYKPTNFDPSNLFQMSPEASAALKESINNMNFVQGAATPEIMNAIQAGGDEALKAIPALINNVAKHAFQASLEASMKISEGAFSKAAPAIDGRMQDILRQRTVSESVRGASDIFQNPAAKPLMDALVPALISKYPNASGEEIRKLAGDYLNDLISAGVPQNKQDASDSGKMSTNWDDWFKGTPKTN